MVAIDKPAGWTSHDVVAKCRRIYGQKRVGHSGTLDPGATGVLLVGLGNATRLLRFLTELPKSYTCDIVLGTATSTLDGEGTVTERVTMSVTPQKVRAAAQMFTGNIMQVPPMVSAVQVGGRRLYELAREGKVVDRLARPVTVYRYDIEPTNDPLVYRARVECSSGTYVRVLVADVGGALGGVAHLRNLRRDAIGSFDADAATPLAELEAMTDPRSRVLSLSAALRDYQSTEVTSETAAAIRHGKQVSIEAGDDVVAVLHEGELIAVFERHDGTLRSAVVVAPS